MNRITISIAAMAMAVCGAATPGLAQDEVLSMSGKESWNSVARSATRAYLVDVETLAVTGDVTSARVARVPVTGEAGDYSYSMDTYEFRCGKKESRTTVSTEYGPDGAETDRYEDASPWEAVRRGSVDETLVGIVCEDGRSEPAYPSLKAFVDAGRP